MNWDKNCIVAKKIGVVKICVFFYYEELINMVFFCGCFLESNIEKFFVEMSLFPSTAGEGCTPW